MSIRAMFAGVTGLKSHQLRMDTIGNNIANVNTVGFKSSRLTFKEAFSQLLRGASRPGENSFGTNPIQVGLGVEVGSVDQNFSQGNLQNTGVATDLAIQGDGFFMVSDGNQDFYTRAGNFTVDAGGRLVSANNGFVVQGKQAVDGVLQETVGDITIPFDQQAAAQATQLASMGGNLDASAVAGDVRESSITVYDSLGKKHELSVEFTKTATPNEWDYAITATGGTVVSGDTGTLTFDGQGRLTGTDSTNFVFTPDGVGSNQTVEVDFGTAGSLQGLTQFAGSSTAIVRDQDGFTTGELRGFTIDATGTITGSFTNSTNQVLGQIALAEFNNPQGLVRDGENLFTESANSGEALVGFAGEGSQSAVTAGALELSNVDLSEQFTDMIATQRGFQSNARVITTADEMLQELVNLKR
jgi:flagellar hook protein FlgE